MYSSVIPTGVFLGSGEMSGLVAQTLELIGV